MGSLTPKQHRFLILFLGVGLLVTIALVFNFSGPHSASNSGQTGTQREIAAGQESSPAGSPSVGAASLPSTGSATAGPVATALPSGTGTNHKIYATGKTLRPEPAGGWPDSPYAGDQESFPGSRLVEELRRPAPDGGVICQRILQVQGAKYPYIRVETTENSAGLEVERQEMVADLARKIVLALEPGF